MAFIIMLAPILPYKYKVNNCMLSDVVEPNICAFYYIPFEEGFPFKFYHSYGPGFGMYYRLEIFGRHIRLENCQDTACESSIHWFIPFTLNLIVLTAISYSGLYLLYKKKFPT